ncbi:MAG: hypothetical protein ACQGQP_07065 [Desulfovibrio sp.]|jgi:hypothetical protein|nr:hypothetical protein [Mailhella sp.]
MITQWPLVIFTVLAQLGAGTALFSTLRTHWGAGPSPRGWTFAAIVSTLAFLAGVSACKGVGSGAMAAAQGACLLLAAFSACALRRMPFCALAACVAGGACVLCQAAASVPGALLSPSGIFPFLLFFLSAGVLGASFVQLPWMDEPDDKAIRYGRLYLPLRFCLWTMLIITAVAPCVPWGDPLMNKSAFYWMQTQLYWLGVIFSGVAIGLSHMGRITLLLQAAVTFISVFGLRTAFFADSVHGAIDLGTLYLR